VLARTVQTIRLRHGRRPRDRGPRPRRGAGVLTVSQLATAVGVKAPWLAQLISRGRIGVGRAEASGRSLLPDRPEPLEACRQWRDGQRHARRDGGKRQARRGRPEEVRGRQLAWAPRRVALRSERGRSGRADWAKQRGRVREQTPALLL
jgi:hypothetical protein